MGSENRIMLVGNSITVGMKSDNGLGFRDELYDQLTSLGYPFSFVGSCSSPPYQGHFRQGACIGEFYVDRIGGDGSFDVGADMDQNQPHIVMIHLGTNDTYLGIPMTPYSYDGGLNFANTVSGRMAHFIDYLLEWQNGIRGNHLRTIVVSQIIPSPYQMDRVNALNGEIARLVEDANGGQIPRIPPGILRIADHYSSFDTGTMFDPDSIHPNDIGYQHMANIYYNTLRFLPMHLVRISNAEDSGLIGTILTDPLKVKVTDDYGNGISNVEVAFEVSEGDAVIVGPQAVLTDAVGFAECTIQLGDFGSSTVVARSSGLIDSTVSFTIQAAGLVQVEGTVNYDGNGSPIPDVKIEWVEGTTMVDTTDQEGRFYIDNLPYGDIVTLQPRKERWSSSSGSEILSYDAALSARYVVGLERLSQQRRLAADVDRDGKVSMNDASQIARYAVGLDLQSGIHIGEWLFSPDNLHYEPLSSNMSSQHFSGILAGDLHSGWSHPSFPKTDVEHKSFELAISSVETDRHIVITLLVEGEHMLSADLICEYDPLYLQLSTVHKTEETNSFTLYYKDHTDGRIHAGLFGTKPLSGETAILEFRFQLDPSNQNVPVLFKHLYVNDCPLDDILYEVGAGHRIATTDESGSVQHFPNPFNEETVIRYQIREDAQVALTIYNSNGQEVIKLIDQKLSIGSYEVIWDGQDRIERVVPSGIYFYRLSVGDEVFVDKMMKVR
ncbi:T9SS type A sorting domain-containing protein [bacterium]|nr:T9SS type A sorting domain-containing protein [bacterium]